MANPDFSWQNPEANGFSWSKPEKKPEDVVPFDKQKEQLRARAKSSREMAAKMTQGNDPDARFDRYDASAAESSIALIEFIESFGVDAVQYESNSKLNSLLRRAYEHKEQLDMAKSRIRPFQNRLNAGGSLTQMEENEMRYSQGLAEKYQKYLDDEGSQIRQMAAGK